MYSIFNPIVVDVHSLGVESIPHTFFLPVLTPDVTRFRGVMHPSRSRPVDKMHLILYESLNLAGTCNVLEGLPVVKSFFPRSVHFHGIFLNVYGRETWLVLLRLGVRGYHIVCNPLPVHISRLLRVLII